ncbi:MAG: tetratricopeptide repeat protein [Bdellovibrionales bacterium]|nr:tetratricopeptide repeat protein [Bdellovibrionales bacterium]
MVKIFYLIVFVFCISCASTISFKEYAFAEAALEASARVDAQRLSPHSYVKAQSYFRQGRVEFNNANYDTARSYFTQAQKLAETAEVRSYIKRSQSGGGTLY